MGWSIGGGFEPPTPEIIVHNSKRRLLRSLVTSISRGHKEEGGIWFWMATLPKNIKGWRWTSFGGRGASKEELLPLYQGKPLLWLHSLAHFLEIACVPCLYQLKKRNPKTKPVLYRINSAGAMRNSAMWYPPGQWQLHLPVHQLYLYSWPVLGCSEIFL